MLARTAHLSKSVLRGASSRSQPQALALVSRHKSAASYTERMEQTGRPISPHITIYKFPIVALSSGTTRFTGFALSIGTWGIGCTALLGGDPGAIMASLGSSGIAPLAKFCVAFPFTYHFCGGLRHVIWDRNPDMLTNQQVEQSSYLVMGAATAISLGMCAMNLE